MPVVIECSHINQTDFTAATGFQAMLADFSARNQSIFWLNPSTEVTHVIKFIAGEAFNTISSPEDIFVNTLDPLLDEVVTDYGAAE